MGHQRWCVKTHPTVAERKLRVGSLRLREEVDALPLPPLFLFSPNPQLLRSFPQLIPKRLGRFFADLLGGDIDKTRGWDTRFVSLSDLLQQLD
jgi:hypothetical protein